MTLSPATIAVTASAEKHIRAERATVRVRISAKSEDDKGQAYDAVARVHNRLEGQARAFRASKAATWHHASSPASFRYKELVSSSGQAHEYTDFYATQSAVTVKFQDFDALADWLAELADEPLVDTGRVEWDITVDTREENESSVRTRAVKNARALATDYAAGEDISPDALRLKSIDASTTSGPHYAAAAARGAAGGSGHAAIAIVPDEITIKAEVTAVYTADEV